MKDKIQVIAIAVMFFALAIIAWIKPADNISDSELRKLAQFPHISKDKLLSGEFMKDFESYTLDQFPFRDDFRMVKAMVYIYGFGQLDNNGIYVEDGYAAKMEYPLNEMSVEHGIERFNNLYSKFIKGTDTKCYITVVPDKNYYLAKKHGAISMDYNRLFEMMESGVEFAKYIDITDLLDSDKYYHTDTHWNQVKIVGVADRLAETMETTLIHDYQIHETTQPFYGVYYGQAALPMKPDVMQFLSNDIIDSATVWDLQNDMKIPVYDVDKMNTRSPYDLFLGGSLSLITIDNPNSLTDKELVVFRDSFGSSLVPLLISGYKKITLVDIRYLPSERIGSFIEFDNQDVLFIYSATVLNNSTTLK